MFFEEYYRGVKSKLQKSWVIPNKEWDKNISSWAVLQVLNDGTIDKAYFEKKSGDEEFDSSVIKAIKNANPLPSFPESNGSCLEFMLVFKSSNKQ